MQPSNDVRDLLDRLATCTGEDLDAAIGEAGWLLEKSAMRFRSRAAMHKAYQDLLTEEQIALTLSPEDIDKISYALLALLDAPDPVPGAAWALHRSGRLFAIPKLAELARRLGPTSGPSALQAVVAVWDILASVARGRLLTPEESKLVSVGRDALEFAATTGVDEDVREIAKKAIVSLTRWVRR
jgi:hypothetical protein